MREYAAQIVAPEAVLIYLFLITFAVILCLCLRECLDSWSYRFWRWFDILWKIAKEKGI